MFFGRQQESIGTEGAWPLRTLAALREVVESWSQPQRAALRRDQRRRLEEAQWTRVPVTLQMPHTNNPEGL